MGAVQPVAVGAFQYQNVGIGQGVRWVKDRQFLPAQVPAEDEPPLFACAELFDFQQDKSRAEDVSRVVVGELYPVRNGDRAPDAYTDKEGQGVAGVFLGIDGFHRRLAPPFAPFVQVLDVHLLDIPAVQQHIGREVAGGRGTPDVAIEALLDQIGQLACVVDVGVAEDDCIDTFGVEGEV